MACSGTPFQQVGLGLRKCAGGDDQPARSYLVFDFKLVAVKTDQLVATTTSRRRRRSRSSTAGCRCTTASRSRTASMRRRRPRRLEPRARTSDDDDQRADQRLIS